MKRILSLSPNLRLDISLSKSLEISRSKAKKLIEDGSVLVNGKLSIPSYQVSESDEIIYNEIEKVKVNLSSTNLEILYEDDDIIIINKDKDVLVHKASNDDNRVTLVDILLDKNYALPENSDRPGIIHRLDKDTSGAIIIAKTSRALERFSSMIKNREIIRKYIAVVHHDFKAKTATITGRIGSDRADKRKKAITDNGKEAVSKITKIASNSNYSLLLVEIISGRTHQIRVHLSSIDYPVVGDPLYSNIIVDNVTSQLLHSYYLSFFHPFLEKRVEIYAPLDKDLESFIKAQNFKLKVNS